MNGVSFSDASLQNNPSYQEFLKDNPSYGILKVRATSVNSALPIENVHVIVSKVFSDTKVIFFDGFTDSSGMISNIELPSPKKDENDEEIPKHSLYDLEAIYNPQKLDKIYSIHIYPGIASIQYINVPIKINMENNNGN